MNPKLQADVTVIHYKDLRCSNWSKWSNLALNQSVNDQRFNAAATLEEMDGLDLSTCCPADQQQSVCSLLWDSWLMTTRPSTTWQLINQSHSSSSWRQTVAAERTFIIYIFALLMIVAPTELKFVSNVVFRVLSWLNGKIHHFSYGCPNNFDDNCSQLKQTSDVTGSRKNKRFWSCVPETQRMLKKNILLGFNWYP